MGTATEEAGQRELQKLRLENEDLKQRIVDLTALVLKHLGDPGARVPARYAMQRH
jgi:hypothetical protein